MTDNGHRWRPVAVFPIAPMRGISGIPNLAALLGAEQITQRQLFHAVEIDVIGGPQTELARGLR